MSSLASSSTGPDRHQESGGQPAGRGLRVNAIRARDVVVLSLASSGPTQSIAVTLAALLATVGYASFLPLAICFIPMLGIAIGYQRLNAWQPSAGATYSWVGRAVNPHLGFFSGWIMLMYYTIGTTSLTIPLGTYMLSFFSNAAANNKYDVALVGTAFNLIVLVVAALGIKLSARFQWVWAIFEYGLLVGFTIAAIVAIYGGKQLMIVAVLGGTLASLQAAIVSSSRISFAMGRDRVFPRWFGTVSEKHGTPWNATILLGLLNVVFLWGSTLIGSIGQALIDIVSTLGLMAAIFYLLTAGTAVWYYRGSILASTGNFIEIAFGFGLAVFGFVLSAISKQTGHSAYYTEPMTSQGDIAGTSGQRP